jgi:hypothetical protein
MLFRYKLIFVILTSNVAIAQERPIPLQAFEQARKAFPSGRIEWSVLREGDPENAMDFVSRYAANGDLIFENRGDKHGWTLFDGETRAGCRRYPQLFMSNQEGFWAHEETTCCCMWWSEKDDESYANKSMKDIRALGIYPTSNSLEFTQGFSTLAGNPSDPLVEWSQETLDDLEIVHARSAAGAKIAWYLNPERGWNAERVVYDTGYGLWEAVSSLANFDGVWFPEETRYYRNGRLTETIIVRSAALNRPEDPKKFTLNDLGLEPGSSVAAQNLPPVSGKDLRTWNGEAIVPFESWSDDVKAGRRVVGPIRKRTFEKGYFESIYDTPEDTARVKLAWFNVNVKLVLSRHVDLWEQYVRDFIERYKLDDEQSQKAWAIFLECRRRGDELIARDKQRMTELVSLSLAAKEAGETEKEAKLDEQVAKMREPVDRIFEESLKPRLDKLPTRAQIKAAETAAESPVPTSSPAP